MGLWLLRETAPMTPEALAALVGEVAEDHRAYQDEEFKSPMCVAGCLGATAPCPAARLLEVVEEQGREIERLLGVKETLNLEAHELSRKLHASEEREKVLAEALEKIAAIGEDRQGFVAFGVYHFAPIPRIAREAIARVGE